jgi:hypothetical protein
MNATYMECSAKERIGVDDIFDSAIVLATAEEDYYDDGHGGIGGGGMAKSRRKRARKACKIL